MKEEAVRNSNELERNYVFSLVRKTRKESEDTIRYMREKYGAHYLNEKDGAKLWRAHMWKI